MISSAYRCPVHVTHQRTPATLNHVTPHVSRPDSHKLPSNFPEKQTLSLAPSMTALRQGDLIFPQLLLPLFPKILFDRSIISPGFRPTVLVHKRTQACHVRAPLLQSTVRTCCHTSAPACSNQTGEEITLFPFRRYKAL